MLYRKLSRRASAARTGWPYRAPLRLERLEDRTLPSSAGAGTSAVLDSAAPVKVQVSDPALTRQLLAEGAQQVADYGSYQLLAVAADRAQTLTDQADVEVHPDYNFVMLNAGYVDTTQQAVRVAALSQPDFAGNIFQLVQFAGPIVPAWYDALVGTGVQVVTPIPSNAYLVYGDSTSMHRLDAWADGAAYVQWVGPYLDEYKLDPQLTPTAQAQAEAADVPVMVSIQLVQDAAANADTLDVINQWRVGDIVEDDLALNYRDLTVELPYHTLRDAIAVRPDVVSIHPHVIPHLMDEAQDLIVVNQLTGTVPTSGADYLTYLASKGFTQAQFDASGFVVDVTDSGIDNGTTSPNHFALYKQGDLTSTSRVVYNRLVGTANSGSTLAGVDGHGNLNAHIIGGYVPSGTVAGTNFDASPHSDANSFKYGLGVAPFVKLGSSVIFDPSTFTSPNYENLQSMAYNSGARISSNSWGADVAGAYDSDAQRYDALVRDAQPSGSTFATAGNQEMVIVFAAGNAGSGTQTVGSPGTGKNVITVGAAENVRAFGGSDGSGISDTGANSANDIISFSSRGPTSDGRFKPEIVAPGTHVTGGVWQASPVMTATGAAAPGFNGSGVSGGTGGSSFFPAGQQYYTASSGTSHSTPAVAGGAALVRQEFINFGVAPPSPALTKASLMASARYLNGVSANDTLWSNNQGMGEMNLDTFFDFFVTPTIKVDESSANTFTASGQTRTFSGVISSTSKPLRITLAWTDAPGPTSGNSYINNLDLEVTIGATTYKGNVFSGASSVAGGTADVRNNAESVFLPAGVSGAVTITIRATNIAGNGVPNFGGALDQDFALVAYNVAELTVTTTVPAVGSVIATQPTSFTVNVTDPVDPLTLQASDFKVNSIAATSVSYTTGTTAITFTFSSTPVTAQGLQTMHIDFGAFARASDASPVLQFDGTFRYDVVLLQVTTTAPAVGGTFTLPSPVTYDVNFNEAVDPTSVQTTDLVLTGIAGASVTAVTVQPGNTTARFTLSLPAEGTLTANIAAGAITDAFGNPGAAFSATMQVDVGTMPYPTPLTAALPLGSLAYSGTFAGLVNVAGDTDNFTLNVDAGQTITVLAAPAAGLQPILEIRDSGNTLLGTVTAAQAGKKALLQAMAVAAGAYTITVKAASSTTGSYTLGVTLNAALEAESQDGAANNTLATAQNIDTSSVSLGGPASRDSVQGTTDGVAAYSAAAVTPTFTDISTTGTKSTGAIGDDAADTLAASQLAGFTFPFYGTTYTSLSFSTNGLISFTTTDTTATNTNLSTSPSEPVIAVLWDDLVLDNTGTGTASRNVFWQVVGFGASQQLIIQWNNAHRFGGSTLYTFEAVLSIDGTVQFNYGSAVNSTLVSSATVGVKAAGTSNPSRLLVSFNQAPGSLVGASLSTRLTAPPIPDYYAFALTAGDTATLAVKTLSSGTVTTTLQDASGATLAVSVPGPSNLDNAITDFVAPATGTYYAVVTGPGVTSYSLTVTRNAEFDTEGNDSLGTAQPILSRQSAGQQWVQGYLDVGNVDVYQITLLGGGFVQAATTTPADGSGEFVNTLDPRIRLLNSAGTVVASDDNSAGDGRNALLSYPVPASQGGTYYLAVSSSPLTASPTTGPYVLRAAIANPATRFAVSAPSSTIAGNTFQVTVTALDQFNATAFGYTGTVTLTSTDPLAPSLGSHTFVLGDAGTFTFTGLVQKTAATQTLTASDSTRSGSSSITVSAAALDHFKVAPTTATPTAGAPFAVVVTAQDVFNNTVVSYTGPVTLTSTDPQAASLGSHTFVAADAGTFAFGVIQKTAGPQTLTASDPNKSGTAAITVNAAAASQLVITTQPSPTATAGVAFATQPVVKEEDQFGNVITTDSSSTVTAARGSHGSAALQGSGLTVTLTNGVATFSGLSYNVAEAMNLAFTSSAAGVSSVTSNDVVVSPAAASQLVITTQPSATAVAGVAFATQPVVKEEDQFGNVIASDSTSTVTASRGSHGTSTLQGSGLTVTLSNGVATFTGLSYNVAEAMNLLFTSSAAGVSSVTSNDVVVSPAAASQLVITTQPSPTATAGVALATQPVVKEEDAFGNVIASDSTSTVTAARGTHGTNTLQGSGLTVTLSNGVATFSGLVYTKAETFNFLFSSGVAGVSTATSNDVVVSPTAASQLVVTTQPSPTATAGVAWATQPVVKEEDQYGNVITTDSTSTVTVARGSHGTTTLQGSPLTVTLASGVATFTGLSYNVAEAMNLAFTTNAVGVTPTTSNDVVVSPAAASQLVITTQPSPTATAGVAFATQPVVKEEDQFGNVLVGDSSSTVTAARGTHGSAALQGSSLTVTLTNGVATFSGLSYNVAQAMNLLFTSSITGVSSITSNDVVVSPAAASQLVVTTQPSPTATAGVAFATQPVVKEEDAFGNVIATDSTSIVTVARGNHGSATLQGSGLIVTLSNGVATFTGLSYNVAEAMNLAFSSSAAGVTSVTSNDVIVSPAAASQLVVTTQPSPTATAGVAWATQPVVKEEDQFGNVITTDSTSTVTVARGSHGTAALQGSPLTVTLASGVATFTGLSYNVAEAMNLAFSSSATGVSSTTSNDVVVSPAAASHLVVTTQPSVAATAGVAFGTQPVVKEEDQFGNVIASDSTSTVTAARGSHGSAALQGSGLTVTLSNGVAVFSGLSYDKAETFNILFTSSATGVSSATSNDVVVSPAAASQLVVTTQPSPTATAGVAFATQPVVKEEDQFGNVIASDNTSTVTAARGSHGNAALQGSGLTVTLSNGVASFSGLSYNVAEAMNLAFSSSAAGVASVTSNDVIVSPAAASQLVVTTQPAPTATAGVAFATQPVVKEEDAFGNVVASDSSSTVTAIRGSHGSAALQGTPLTVTLANGVAAFTGLSYNVAEAMNLAFSSSAAGVSSATSNDVVVSPAAASQLIVTIQPSPTATAGVAFATQPVVKEEDPFGNVIVTDSSSTVTVARGSHGSAAVQGSGLIVTLSNGVATFTGLSYNVAEAVNLLFTSSAPGVASATSNDIVVSPAPASHLLFGQQPTNTTATATISPAVTVRLLDQFGNLINSTATVSVSAGGPDAFTAASTVSVAAVAGVATFNNLHLNTDGAYAISASAAGYGTATSNSFNVQGLAVTSFTPTANGFVATFSEPFDPTQLNLYNASSINAGAADVTLVGSGLVGNVSGSLLIDPSNTRVTFVKTTIVGANGLPVPAAPGTLAAANYTATFASGAGAFVSPSGDQLDGNANGTGGDAYSAAFTVNLLPSNAVIANLADFARGPGNTVNVPNNAGPALGLPLSLTVQAPVQTLTLGSGITGGSFRLTFNGRNTAAISWSSSGATLASRIQTALASLPNVHSGNVTVSGTGPFTVTFASAVGNPNLMTVNNNSLTPSGRTITLTNPNGPTSVTDGTFTLDYNASLLTISGSTVSPALGGASFTVTTTGSGASAVATIVFHSATGLDFTTAGAYLLGGLTAAVPSNTAATAQYKAKGLLHFDLSAGQTTVNGGALPLIGNDGLDLVAYLADTDGSGDYTSLDGGLLAKVGGGEDSGFGAYRLVDPLLLGDINSDGIVNNTDGVIFASFLNTPPVPQIPPATGVTPAFFAPGPDPLLSIPADLRVGADGTVTVPVNLDDARPAGSSGLTQARLALTYDPAVFTVTAADVHLGGIPASGSGWTLTTAVDAATGQLGIRLSSLTPIATSVGGSLVTIDFHRTGALASGTTSINLAATVNPNGQGTIRTALFDGEDRFILSPAPTNAAGDLDIDGTVALTSSSPPPAETPGSTSGVEEAGTANPAPVKPEDASSRAADASTGTEAVKVSAQDAPADAVGDTATVPALSTLSSQTPDGPDPLSVLTVLRDKGPAAGLVGDAATVPATGFPETVVVGALPFLTTMGTPGGAQVARLVSPLASTSLVRALPQGGDGGQHLADHVFLALGGSAAAFDRFLAAELLRWRPTQDSLIWGSADAELDWLVGHEAAVGERFDGEEPHQEAVPDRLDLEQHLDPLADEMDL